MSLRTQIHVIIATLMALFIGALVAQEVSDTRGSVREEVEASNVVATHLLTRMTWVYEQAGTGAMVSFLTSVGHVRANDVTLYDDQGALVYRSPPPQYKAGLAAPAWFARLVAPSLEPQQIQVAGGRLVIQADPSRAILDGWDGLERLVIVGGAACTALFALAFWLSRRALAPFGRIVAALEQVEQGAYDTRLPELPGREAQRMRAAFNRMAQAVEETAAAKRAAHAAQSDLEQSRELTRTIQTHIEAERRAIARELHDELGQSITAIKSMGQSIIQRTEAADARTVGAARMIVETATRLYDGVHALISRLRPMAIDDFGLADALRDLVTDLRQQHPDVRFSLNLGELPPQESLGDALATCVYRIVQESVTNALRHGRAASIAVEVGARAGRLQVRVEDDGKGLDKDWDRPGHFGVRGMQERARALGGILELAAGTGAGVAVNAALPLYTGA